MLVTVTRARSNCGRDPIAAAIRDPATHQHINKMPRHVIVAGLLLLLCVCGSAAPDERKDALSVIRRQGALAPTHQLAMVVAGSMVKCTRDGVQTAMATLGYTGMLPWKRLKPAFPTFPHHAGLEYWTPERVQTLITAYLTFYRLDLQPEGCEGVIEALVYWLKRNETLCLALDILAADFAVMGVHALLVKVAEAFLSGALQFRQRLARSKGAAHLIFQLLLMHPVRSAAFITTGDNLTAGCGVPRVVFNMAVDALRLTFCWLVKLWLKMNLSLPGNLDGLATTLLWCLEAWTLNDFRKMSCRVQVEQCLDIFTSEAGDAAVPRGLHKALQAAAAAAAAQWARSQQRAQSVGKPKARKPKARKNLAPTKKIVKK